MKNLPLAVIELGLLLASVTGCKESGVSVDIPQPGLYAHVVDASGNPLPGVDVHYVFYTTTNPVMLNAIIQYSLVTPQVVTVKVFDPFDTEVQTVIDAQNQLAGLYRVNVAPPVTNGIYACKVLAGSTAQTTSFFIRTDDIAQLQQKPPLLRSDSKGEFYLSPSQLGIGRRFSAQDRDDEVITDSISVVLARTGFQTLVQSVAIDSTQVISKTFILTSN